MSEPLVRVTFPNGGERFQPNQQIGIQWQSSDTSGLVAHDVKFSSDGGANFIDIATNLPGFSQSFNWSVPNVLTSQGIVRVVARNTLGLQSGDRSDASFTIAQPVDTMSPTVQVTFPNGGQQLQPGQQVTITWTSSDNVGVVAHDVKFSATGGEPFQDIITNLPGSQKSFNWTVPNTPTNQGLIRVVARDAAGNQGGDRSDTPFTIAQPVDTIPPTVQVTFPNGGQQLQPGQQVTITWTSSDNVGVVAHDVKFSATGGEPFQDNATNLPGSQKSFNWTVPNLPTNQGVIRVVARDAAGNQGGDRSDAFFTIAQPVDTIPPTVQVTFPNGGQQLQPGQQVTITWTSSDNVGVVAHDVKFSATGGEPFQDIVTNLSGSQKSFAWTVPNAPTSQGLIRVVARDAAGNQGGDRSDTPFTIAQPVDTIPPTVQVTFPSGGQQLQPGQQVTITWTSSDNVGVVAHDVKFSATGGEPFQDIVTNLPGSQKSFNWTVPNAPTSQGLIRVVARDAAGNQGGDRSDTPFTIAQPVDTIPPTVQVTFPNGGQQLQPGQQVTITWTSSDNVGVVAHDVKFSATGGEPFQDIVTNLPGSQKSFSWTVPNAPTSQGVIRVVARDAAGNQGGDRSDASFTIAQPVDTIPPTVQVTFPNGGQQLQPGQQVTITWTSSDNVGVVAHDVKFSATGGEPFQDIATNLSGSQKSFAWTVPNVPTNQGVIRVVARDAAGNQGGDRSDTPFTIAQPVDTIPPTVQVTFPNGGQQFQPGQQVTITWTSSDNVGVVAHDVKFSATGGEPFQDITTNLPGSQKSFNWTVPNAPTNQGLIRVVARDAAGNQGGDRSDSNFRILAAVPAPQVTSVSPNSGPPAGGVRVQITGGNFVSGCTVRFGNEVAIGVTFINSGALTAEIPPQSGPGRVTVVVINPDGQEGILPNAFEYIQAPAPSLTAVTPANGPLDGGTPVTLTGSNFQDGARVFFAEAEATGVLRPSASEIRCLTPRRSGPGAVEVRVLNLDRQEARLASGFSYDEPTGTGPRITSVEPDRGPLAGGTRITVRGANFVSGCTLRIGDKDARNLTLVDASTLTADTPRQDLPARVDLRVINPDGQKFTLAQAFLYEGDLAVAEVVPAEGPAKLQPGEEPQIATVVGLFFRPGAKVRFGQKDARTTYIDDSHLQVEVPESDTTGPVRITVLNPDGKTATLDKGFTYLGPKQLQRARVSSVSTPSLVEGQPAVVEIRGNNLRLASSQGVLGFRVPARLVLRDLAKVEERFDEAAKQDVVQFRFTPVASPALGALESAIIQVVASLRPAAADDAVFETSAKGMVTVYSSTSPIPIAFTASLPKGQRSVLLVSGLNLQDAQIELRSGSGSGVEISYQRSEERLIGAIVEIEPGVGDSFLNLVVQKKNGGEVGTFRIGLAAAATSRASRAAGGPEQPDPEARAGVNALRAVEGRRYIGARQTDSKVYDAKGRVFDGTAKLQNNDKLVPGIKIPVFTTGFILPVLNEVRLFPLFTRPGVEITDAERVVREGVVFAERALALIFVVQVDVAVRIEVAVFVSINPFVDFASPERFDEISDPAFGNIDVFGTLVIGIGVTVTVDVVIRAFVALVLPNQDLLPLAAFGLDLQITSGPRGTQLNLGGGLYVRTQLGPAGIAPRALAEASGLRLLARATFEDPSGLGRVAYYFARQAGRACFEWDFDLTLLQGFAGGARETPLFNQLRATACVQVRQNDRTRQLMIEPESQSLTPGQTKAAKAFVVEVDRNGKPQGKRDKLAVNQVTFAPADELQTVFSLSQGPDPDNPGSIEWLVTGNQGGTALLRAAVPTTGAPGLAVYPPSVLGFLLRPFVNEGTLPQPLVDESPVFTAAPEIKPRAIHPVEETIYVQRPWLNVAYSEAYTRVEFTVAKDEGFQNVVEKLSATRIPNNPNNITYGQVSKDLAAGTTYFWKAQVFVANVAGPISGATSFTLAPAGEIKSKDGETWCFPLGPEHKDLVLSGNFCEGYFHEGYRGRKLHAGVDWPVEIGTEVFAARSGVRGPLTGPGGLGDHGADLARFNTFRLIHRDMESNYVHMNPLENRLLPGTYVNQGTRVGKSNKLGTKVPHLHFDIASAGQEVFFNPLLQDLTGWSRPSGGDPVLFSVRLRGGAFVNEDAKTGLKDKIFVIVQGHDRSKFVSIGKSTTYRMAPVRIALRDAAGNPLKDIPDIQFNEQTAQNREELVYAYQTRELAGKNINRFTDKTDQPFFYFFELPTKGRPPRGPETITAEIFELDPQRNLARRQARTVIFGPEVRTERDKDKQVTVRSGQRVDVPIRVRCTNSNLDVSGDRYGFKLQAPAAVAAKLIETTPTGDLEVQREISFLSGETKQLRLRLEPPVGAPKGKFTLKILVESRELVLDFKHELQIEVTVA